MPMTCARRSAHHEKRGMGMAVAIVTGSGGLIGSAAVRRFAAGGFDVVGVENDMRAQFFGDGASTAANTQELISAYDTFHSVELDIRDREGIERLFAEHAGAIELIVHTAAQPSHDWAASDPHTDFTVNANGTLNLLQAAREHAPGATFVFTSTNKVYGDLPNQLPLLETDTRLELPADHRWHGGIDTTMSIDRSMHSLFGASKAAADLLVQEYGRYFDMPTVCFRGGCLTGPQHAGAQLHGFLADPRPAAVYNLGGGRASNCSMLEAIALSEEIAGRELQWTLSDEARMGDHRWWVSDLGAFEADYPSWSLTRDVPAVLREIHDANVERWQAVPS